MDGRAVVLLGSLPISFSSRYVCRKWSSVGSAVGVFAGGKQRSRKERMKEKREAGDALATQFFAVRQSPVREPIQSQKRHLNQKTSVTCGLNPSLHTVIRWLDVPAGSSRCDELSTFPSLLPLVITSHLITGTKDATCFLWLLLFGS